MDSKVRVATLLFIFGLIMMVGIGQVKKVDAQRPNICPQICYDNLDYMTCPSTGYKKLEPSCSCCMAPEDGCILYFTNGNDPEVCN
ncbi:proteinase inhibitor PSI-1.2-like [Amaranthus tricolor]|uniref:proteinase inhibitor PSI-1.2-like n=1 Tax=Amaranthus tricolor TaxID=29722 RepID=UPI00258915F8|nr:proteinase inhibitor PSI-1.2-like [Amaranthus tricolor]